MSFPVSIKGVLLEAGHVVLLENERSEWELPGGRLEAGEDPVICLAREFAEELGIKVAVKTILDSWVYEVSPAQSVVIVTYGAERVDQAAVCGQCSFYWGTRRLRARCATSALRSMMLSP